MTNDTVIVSLTTHSIRVAQVAKTAIFSILQNTYKDVHIVLTLYKDDLKLITPDLQLLIDNNLIELIVTDEDLGPHKKYFYTMLKYKDNPIITIDDDAIYPKTMIEEMVKAYKENPHCVIARRCFNMSGSNGKIDLYRVWMSHFSGKSGPSHTIFATGVGGILYPPNCFNISNENLKEIYTIRYDDDFYLKALEIRNDYKVVSICPSWDKLFKKNLDDSYTQSIALWNRNRNGGSDKCIEKYKKEFLLALEQK